MRSYANVSPSFIFYYFLLFIFLNNSCLTISAHSFWRELDDGNKKAFIRKQAAELAKKRLEGVVPLTIETTQAKPFIKRKLKDKGDRPPKKLKEVVATTVGETPSATQMPLPLHHGVSKGLMTAKGRVLE